jgi:hypothetical protein
MANVYVQQRDQQGQDSTRVRAFNDSALAVAREVLAIDPASRPALTIQYAGLQAAGQRDEATDVSSASSAPTRPTPACSSRWSTSSPPTARPRAPCRSSTSSSTTTRATRATCCCRCA